MEAAAAWRMSWDKLGLEFEELRRTGRRLAQLEPSSLRIHELSRARRAIEHDPIRESCLVNSYIMARLPIIEEAREARG